MNILVFSWRCPEHPLAGGAEQVMHEHMKGWISAGHKVTLFASHFSGAKRVEKIDGVAVVRRGIQYWGVHLLGAIYYLFGNHKKFDLVVDQFHGIPFFTPLYVRVKKLAVLQEVAGEVWLKNDLPFPLDKIIGLIGYFGEPLLFLPYKRVKFMVGSNSAREDLSRMGIKREFVTVVPHGTIIHRPKPMPKKEKKKTIAFLGALAKDKGIEDAIKCFSLLNRKERYNFWVIGRCAKDYLRDLKKLSKNLGVGHTKFFGFVSDSRKFELLARVHVMVNPSLLEGFGLVNIEANAMGIPVIGYTSRGLVDSIKNGESGYLVFPNTPKELTRKVESLLKDEMKYKKLSESSIKWSKNFTWDSSRKQSLFLIENL